MVFRRAAIIVAHPDDECLWGGGLPIRYPGDWTIIACSIPRRDPIRAWKFFDACRALGAEGRLLPFAEPEANASLASLDAIDLSPFEIIVTHNGAGEYGHEHHRQVHRHVVARAPERTWTFGWRIGGAGRFGIRLDEPEAARKMAALRCYDHRASSDGGLTKWQALIERYRLELTTETYDPPAC